MTAHPSLMSGCGLPLDPFSRLKWVRLVLVLLDLVVVTQWCVRVRFLPPIVLILREIQSIGTT